MHIDFGQKMNDGISVNSPRTIRSISPQITITRQGRLNVFNSIRGMSDLDKRRAAWYGVVKSESETLEATIFSKIMSTNIILKLKSLGTKIL